MRDFGRQGKHLWEALLCGKIPALPVGGSRKGPGLGHQSGGCYFPDFQGRDSTYFVLYASSLSCVLATANPNDLTYIQKECAFP